MIIRDIIVENQEIFELRMSPADLRRQAAGIDAIAGMEFEIAFPDANLGNEDDEDIEPDYDEDIRVRTISDIIEFFDNDGVNSTRDLNRLNNTLQEEMAEWAQEQAEEEFLGNTEDIVLDYIKRNYSADQDDEDERLKRAIEEKNSDYENARDEYIENFLEDTDETTFLQHNGITVATDVLSSYDITWPFFTTSRSTSGPDAEELAMSFAEALDVDYNLSNRYSGAKRSSSAYAIEPDGSIEPAGLEFVSPPLPIPTMLDHLKQVQKWASGSGGETNSTTGLHMNVSIPGKDFSKLDLLKLVLLLGDEYVLNQFERIGNTYAVSALDKITNLLKSQPERVPDILAQLKQGLNRAANSVAFHVMQNKYVSISLRPSYVEFRSPGGDWLNQDLKKLENTLLRFVVALDAALDPTKNQREYYAKLYKLLTPASASPADQSVIDLFARASAGNISKAGLIKLLRQRELSRVEKTPAAASGRKYVWSVRERIGWGRLWGATALDVLATNEKEAIQLAQLMVPEWESSLVATLERVYRPGAKIWYRVINDRGNIQNLQAGSELEALQKMRLSSPELFGPQKSVKVEKAPVG